MLTESSDVVEGFRLKARDLVSLLAFQFAHPEVMANAVMKARTSKVRNTPLRCHGLTLGVSIEKSTKTKDFIGVQYRFVGVNSR